MSESRDQRDDDRAAGEDRADGPMVIVGVGASAGGLEALAELVRHVPTDCMAFIVVQHLSPDRPSLLAELLARSSRLAVKTAEDGMRVEPNHVYVIPPNTDLAVMHDVIHLVQPAEPRAPRWPVDFLFRSIALDKGPRAIGIVLSGTGSDGTLGLEAIKAAGGVTFVQDPESAKYDGMPRSALASGSADFCLPPRGIGEELARIAHRHDAPEQVTAPPPQAGREDVLSKLFLFIRSAFGVDLSHYKGATVERRIQRRMVLHKIGRLEDYVTYVQKSDDELQALYRDMLITVTSFFREPQAFSALAESVLPKLLEQDTGRGVRVWVPACATGEEAYSLAILLLEASEHHRRDLPIQIFGTDVDEDSIQHARAGAYPPNISLDVSPERLKRFFVQKDGDFHVSRRVRDLVVFSRQNVLKDAPFSRMDLVSCRNLLIYLQPAAQKRVLRVLNYALNPSGYLLLGASETVADAPELFSVVDRKHKIYAKRVVAAQAGIGMSLGAAPPAGKPYPPSRATSSASLQSLADRKVLELYGPPGVVVSDQLEILHFRGQGGPYFDPAPGAASLNLLRVVRFELHVELKSAIEKVLAEDRRVTTEVKFRRGDQPHRVNLVVIPLRDPATRARCLLVLFEPLPLTEPIVPAGAIETEASAGQLALRVRELEKELEVTREYLQTTIEEKESANEELKAANEELQSANEELQSTNEELETSKEEMQSTNEELTTVNDELHDRMTELGQTNDDLYNVLAGVDHAVVIVGMDLRIRRYTAAAERLFHLVAADVGRSVGFLDPFLGTGDLEQKVSAVVESLSTLESELLASNQRWYALRISPYKTLDHSIRGALVSLADIDVRKRAEEVTRDAGAYAARVLAPIGHPLLIVDAKLRVVWANEPFYEVFQLAQEETVGSALPSLSGGRLADPGLAGKLQALLARSSMFRDYRMQLRLPDLGTELVRVGGSLIPASSETTLALLSVEPMLHQPELER